MLKPIWRRKENTVESSSPAAKCSTVLKFLSFNDNSSSLPLSSNIFTISALRYEMAKWRELFSEESVAVISTPWSNKTFALWLLPRVTAIRNGVMANMSLASGSAPFSKRSWTIRLWLSAAALEKVSITIIYQFKTLSNKGVFESDW